MGFEVFHVMFSGISHLVYVCSVFFSGKSQIIYEEAHKNSYHYHGRSKFTDLQLDLMASTTDEKYDVVKNIFKTFIW